MKKIFVAGHRGMVGSAICRQLENHPDVEVVTRGRDDLDLTWERTDRAQALADAAAKL